jgi:hypothetical protein
MGMITVSTDVVRENAQTYRLGWSEQCKDGTKMGVGLPEYVLLFRKPPTDKTVGLRRRASHEGQIGVLARALAVRCARALALDGNRLLRPRISSASKRARRSSAFREYSATSIYDHEHMVSIAEARDRAGQLPPGFMLLQPDSHLEDVWTDVTRMRTLNGAQYAAGKEMHICPLQFDIVDRLITRFSNAATSCSIRSAA